VEILADTALFALANFEDLFLQLEQLLVFCELFEGTLDDLGNELEEVDVFDEIIERTAFHHLNRDAFIALACDDNEGNGALDAREVIDQILALDVVQFEIEQHQVGAIFLEPGDCVLAGKCGCNRKALALKCLLNEAQKALVIINNKNRCGRGFSSHRTATQPELSRVFRPMK
jgi:hypothetical protein